MLAAYNGLEHQSVKEAAKHGGGNAPDGVCGALHAVKLLRPDLEDVVNQEFIKHAGSIKCREIKSHGKDSYPC